MFEVKSSMIWDSVPWKMGLLRDADKLEVMKLGNEEADIVFEKTLFVTGLAIRKLVEAKKLTDRVVNTDVKCTRLPLIDAGRFPDLMNWHHLDRFYDFATPQKGTAKLSLLTNQLIHSFIFISVVDDGENNSAVGFYLTTDFDRKKFLAHYDLEEIVRIMRLIGRDDVVQSKRYRDEKGDWVVANYGIADPEVSKGAESRERD